MSHTGKEHNHTGKEEIILKPRFIERDGGSYFDGYDQVAGPVLDNDGQLYAVTYNRETTPECYRAEMVKIKQALNSVVLDAIRCTGADQWIISGDTMQKVRDTMIYRVWRETTPNVSAREWWMAIGPSGKVYQIGEGDKPAMLPPCSSSDLPTWIKVREVVSSETPRVLPFEDWVREIKRIVGEAMGFASMCWEPRPNGVFDSSLCADHLDLTVERVLAQLDLSLTTDRETEKLVKVLEYEATEKADDELEKALERIRELEQTNDQLQKEVKRMHGLSGNCVIVTATDLRKTQERIKELEAELAEITKRFERNSIAAGDYSLKLDRARQALEKINNLYCTASSKRYDDAWVKYLGMQAGQIAYEALRELE